MIARWEAQLINFGDGAMRTLLIILLFASASLPVLSQSAIACPTGYELCGRGAAARAERPSSRDRRSGALARHPQPCRRPEPC